jgi:hypothetical protein
MSLVVVFASSDWARRQQHRSCAMIAHWAHLTSACYRGLRRSIAQFRLNYGCTRPVFRA